jgi:hypothetical protein
MRYHQARNLTLLDTTPGFLRYRHVYCHLALKVAYTSATRPGDLDVPPSGVRHWRPSGRFHQGPCQEPSPDPDPKKCNPTITAFHPDTTQMQTVDVTSPQIAFRRTTSHANIARIAPYNVPSFPTSTNCRFVGGLSDQSRVDAFQIQARPGR